jgi:hypothetical protein
MCSAMLVSGVLLLASPFALRWWLFGDHDRYERIVAGGPSPYVGLGDNIVLLWLSVGSLLFGSVLVAFSVLGLVELRRGRFDRSDRGEA